MLSNWHIEGRDVYIQDWETNEEISIEQAQEILNKFAQLEAENESNKNRLRQVKSPCRVDNTFVKHCRGCERLHDLERHFTKVLEAGGEDATQ